MKPLADEFAEDLWGRNARMQTLREARKAERTDETPRQRVARLRAEALDQAIARTQKG